MDINNSKEQRTIRERAERTQIEKKRSISLSLAATINDDVEISTTIIKCLTS